MSSKYDDEGAYDDDFEDDFEEDNGGAASPALGTGFRAMAGAGQRGPSAPRLQLAAHYVRPRVSVWEAGVAADGRTDSASMSVVSGPSGSRRPATLTAKPVVDVYSMVPLVGVQYLMERLRVGDVRNAAVQQPEREDADAQTEAARSSAEVGVQTGSGVAGARATAGGSGGDGVTLAATSTGGVRSSDAGAAGSADPGSAAAAMASRTRLEKFLRAAAQAVERVCEENVAATDKVLRPSSVVPVMLPGCGPVKVSLPPHPLLARRRVLCVAPSPAHSQLVAYALSPQQPAPSVPDAETAGTLPVLGSGERASARVEVLPKYCAASIIALLEGDTLRTVAACPGLPLCMAFSASGDLLVAGTPEGVLHAWRLSESAHLHRTVFGNLRDGVDGDATRTPSPATPAPTPTPKMKGSGKGRGSASASASAGVGGGTSTDSAANVFSGGIRFPSYSTHAASPSAATFVPRAIVSVHCLQAAAVRGSADVLRRAEAAHRATALAAAGSSDAGYHSDEFEAEAGEEEEGGSGSGSGSSSAAATTLGGTLSPSLRDASAVTGRALILAPGAGLQSLLRSGQEKHASVVASGKTSIAATAAASLDASFCVVYDDGSSELYLARMLDAGAALPVAAAAAAAAAVAVPLPSSALATTGVGVGAIAGAGARTTPFTHTLDNGLYVDDDLGKALASRTKLVRLLTTPPAPPLASSVNACAASGSSGGGGSSAGSSGGSAGDASVASAASLACASDVCAADASRLFVAHTDGSVHQVSLTDARLCPARLGVRARSEQGVRPTTLASHPRLSPFLLAGYADGSCALFHVAHAAAVCTWPASAAAATAAAKAGSGGAGYAASIMYVGWLPSRDTAFVSVSSAGLVSFWDLSRSSSAPVYEHLLAATYTGAASADARARAAPPHSMAFVCAAALSGGGPCAPRSATLLVVFSSGAVIALPLHRAFCVPRLNEAATAADVLLNV